ncbi:aminoglycoside phosphotransferase [Frondihabitans sp. PAMC 28766]|nr:aminoglycoside phosphotransferase [Frondihabitans sp. PAMC 28766]
MLVSQIPTGPVPVPVPIAEIAGSDTVTPVWLNEVGGITFQLGEGPSRRFAKWAPHGVGLDLAAEEARLRWAVAYTSVPRVLASGTGPDADWLVTAGVPGRSAVDPRWRAEPVRAVAALGQGLRAFHDALPVEACPFDWSVEMRLARSEKARRQDPGLPPVPSLDRLVVCQGDPCSPNTLIADDGAWSGHVDLDALGVADRWADIAVATMSLEWNYGLGWDAAFLEAYGIEPDSERTSFYRALWNGT